MSCERSVNVRRTSGELHYNYLEAPATLQQCWGELTDMVLLWTF